jgi:hypothetical protein
MIYCGQTKHDVFYTMRTEVTIGHLEIAIIAKKKPQQARSKGKIMLELFFDSSGIVHMEFIPGATVNKHRIAINAIQFAVSSLSFGAGRTGCCCMTTPLHIILCLSKRSWQNNSHRFTTPSILA